MTSDSDGRPHAGTSIQTRRGVLPAGRQLAIDQVPRRSLPGGVELSVSRDVRTLRSRPVRRSWAHRRCPRGRLHRPRPASPEDRGTARGALRHPRDLGRLARAVDRRLPASGLPIRFDAREQPAEQLAAGSPPRAPVLAARRRGCDEWLARPRAITGRASLASHRGASDRPLSGPWCESRSLTRQPRSRSGWRRRFWRLVEAPGVPAVPTAVPRIGRPRGVWAVSRASSGAGLRDRSFALRTRCCMRARASKVSLTRRSTGRRAPRARSPPPAPLASCTTWWRRANSPHQNADINSHCVHQPSACRCSRTARTASTTPSRNANSSFDTTAANSWAPHLRKTARPVSPSAGASAATGASSRYSRLKIAASSSRSARKHEQQQHSENARRDQQEPADARPGAVIRAELGRRRRRPVAVSRRFAAADRAQQRRWIVDRVTRGTVGRQREEDRAVGARGAKQSRAVLDRGGIRPASLRAPGRRRGAPTADAVQTRTAASASAAARSRGSSRDGSRHQSTSPNSR